MPKLLINLKNHINHFKLDDIKQLQKVLGMHHIFSESNDDEQKIGTAGPTIWLTLFENMKMKT